MIDSNVIAIDLAKTVFQVCKLSPRGKIIWNKQVTRSKLIQILVKERRSLVAMESCSGTHYWSRYAERHGHKVKASRTITLDEQCQQGITVMRDLAVRQKVALAKQLRDQLLDD